MAPKNKNKKVSLNDFLADDEHGGSWADEMADLPTAPAPRDSSARRGGDYLSTVPDRAERGSGYGGGRERDYPPREELPVPDKPPFTAFVGNLAFDLTDGDVEQYFAPNKTVSIRIVSGNDGKPKGFGYVEFASREDLLGALERTGGQMAGRTVRVSVAEAPKGHGDRPGFAPSVAEEASQWRRAGPLPSSNESPSRSGPSRGNSFMRSDSTSGFDNMDVAGGARSGFGSKFSAAPAGRDGPPHASRGRSFVEPSGEPGPADDASTWRTGKAPEAPPRRGSNAPTTPSGPGRAPSFRRDATDVDEKYASQERMGFGSKFTPAPASAATPPPESPRAQRAGFGFGGDRRGSAAPSPAAGTGGNSEPQNWRSAKRPSQDASTAGAAPPTGPSSPVKAERKKLELKARSTDPSTATASTSSPSSNRPSPFGEARPVDASEREKEIEERLRVRKEEEKAKREKEAQEKKEKSAADKTKSPPSGPKADRVSAATAATTDSQTSTSTQDAAATTTSEKDATPKQPSAPPANPWRKNWGDKPSENSSSPKTEESKPASTNSTSTPATASTTDSKSEETSKSTSTTESSKPAPTPKTSAQTGAWGARKPSGHLAAEKEKENKEKETKTNGDGGIAATVTETVKEVAETVKEKAIELNESAEKFGHDG